MATHEQIEELKIDENVFELAEDTELKYLVHFAAPFTGSAKCVIPKGTLFARMEAHVKDKYEDLFTRLQGFSFFRCKKMRKQNT